MCGDTHCGLQRYGTMSLKTVNTNITVPSSSRLPLRWERIFLRNVTTQTKMSRSVVITWLSLRPVF